MYQHSRNARSSTGAGGIRLNLIHATTLVSGTFGPGVKRAGLPTHDQLNNDSPTSRQGRVGIMVPIEPKPEDFAFDQAGRPAGFSRDNPRFSVYEAAVETAVKASRIEFWRWYHRVRTNPNNANGSWWNELKITPAAFREAANTPDPGMHTPRRAVGALADRE